MWNPWKFLKKDLLWLILCLRRLNSGKIGFTSVQTLLASWTPITEGPCACWVILNKGPCIFLSSFFFFFLGMDHFLSHYWICYNITSVLCFSFFGYEVCEFLAPQPGIKPTPHELEGEVFTTGPPGKSLGTCIFILHWNLQIMWLSSGEGDHEWLKWGRVRRQGEQIRNYNNSPGKS